jgi:amino acid transporter
MMFDFVGVLFVVVLIALFAFLFLRAWGSKRAWLKWLGSFLAALLTVVCTLVLILALIGFYKLNALQPNPVSNLKAGGSPEQFARAGAGRPCVPVSLDAGEVTARWEQG